MADLLLPLALAHALIQLLAWAWIGAGLRRAADAQPDAAAADSAAGAAPPDGATPPVAFSVVVAAHEEAEALPALLDRLAAQSHRPFEVVIVDDRSTDATADVVRQRAAAFPVPLRLVTVAAGEPEPGRLPPKKHALTLGIASAAHDRLALTDADGRPPTTWLAALARALDGPDDDAVLVGYGPYTRRPGLLNRFVRYETVQTATLAAAAVGWGRPWHAAGRSLSYARAVFERVGGFAASAASLSGDDDLFVQAVARQRAAPVRFVLDGEAHVPSEAPPSAAAFWRQKRRHASAGGHYPAAVLVALALFHASNVTLWFAAPLLHAVTGSPAGWGLLAAKLLLQRTALAPAFEAFGAEADLRLFQPLLDALSAVYHTAFAALGALPAPRRW